MPERSVRGPDRVIRDSFPGWVMHSERNAMTEYKLGRSAIR